MQTATFIQASAQVTQITSLIKGNVYKRLDEGSYGGDKIVYGIVLDVLYNGVDAAIQVIEFEPGYQTLNTNLKTFAGGKEIKVFPAIQAELSSYLADCVKSLERDVETQRKALAAAEDKVKQAREIVSGDLVKNLTTPAYSDGTALPEKATSAQAS